MTNRLDTVPEPLELPLGLQPTVPVLPSTPPSPPLPLSEDLLAFRDFGQPTQTSLTRFTAPDGARREVPTFTNEFWTAKQRQASSLHEVSYRACFKPQLPRFFIERLTQPGDVVYDPFMGRGTTPVEASLLGRIPWGNDVNPLSIVMTRPRLNPPTLEDVAARLKVLPLEEPVDTPEDLHVFFHPKTLRAICSLRKYLIVRRNAGTLDSVDEWLAMVATNRLTGHSAGFFSVYTLPPNQAVSIKSQEKINLRRNQVPPPRNVRNIILKKTRQLLGDVDSAAQTTLKRVSSKTLLLTSPADATPQIPTSSVGLAVTSPPFLNVVQYATDNWLRCWFLGIDSKAVKLTIPRKLEDWQAAMTQVFHELHRVLKPGGHIAFEVGEVHSGATKLEETVLTCGVTAGLTPLLVLINDQEFTKTANCWGVDNMARGTNTNRVVVFKK